MPLDELSIGTPVWGYSNIHIVLIDGYSRGTTGREQRIIVGIRFRSLAHSQRGGEENNGVGSAKVILAVNTGSLTGLYAHSQERNHVRKRGLSALGDQDRRKQGPFKG